MKLKVRLFTLFLFIASFCFGSDYYWVGASGNWSDINHWATSSGGTTKHSVVPSPQDNVIFDGNSFQNNGDIVTMNLGITTCRDLIFNGITTTHSLTGLTSALKIFGSLKLSPNTNLNYSSDLFFEALSPGHTITTSGKFLQSDVYFNGIGGAYTLLDSLNVTKSVYFNFGELNTNGMTFRCADFLSKNTNTRVLKIIGSRIYTNSWSVTGTNLSLTAQNSKIYIDNTSGEFEHFGTAIYYDVAFTNKLGINPLTTTDATFHNVWFAGNGNINGNNTYDSLILGYGKKYFFEQSKIQTFLLGLRANGHCSYRIELKSSGSSQAVFSKSSGTVIIDQAKLENIAAVGGAAFTANSSIDMGGNTGWIINAPAPLNLYWVGGGGDWDDTLHWSYTSGGPGGACIPRKTDNVFFDINSFTNLNQAVMLVLDTAECNNMTWTATSWKPVFDGNLGVNMNIYGSLEFCKYLDVKYVGETRFKATTTGKTILMNGCSFPYPVYFDGNNGGWTLLDTFRTESVLILLNGHLNTNSKTVYSYRFESKGSYSKILTLGSSHYYVTGFGTSSTWFADGLHMTLNAGTSIIKFTADTAGMLNDNATQLVYYNVEFLDTGGLGLFTNASTTFNRVSFWGNSQIFGVSIISDLMLYKNTYCELSAGQTQYILDSLIAFGDCTGKIMIYSSNQGTNSTFSKASGTINVDQVILKDIAAGGNAVFTATNSYDLGNNTNWIFTTLGISNRYWIGGTGNWDDTSHWSYSSGGPGGACVPTPSDNVFFDANSFSAAGQIVDINVGNATCRDMDWTGSLYNPEFSGHVMHNLRIFGSLTFVQSMTLTFAGVTYFEATSLGKTITLAGNFFNKDVIFRGVGGGWTFQDDFGCSNNLIFLHGNLYFNGKNVFAARFLSEVPNIRVLDIASSNVNLGAMLGTVWKLSANNLTFSSDSSSINILGGFGGFLTTGNGYLNYWNVIFSSSVGNSNLNSNAISCNFKKVAFYHSGIIYGTNSYDTLYFAAGTSNVFQSGYSQTVNVFIAIGNCLAPISFTSTGGPAANLIKNSGNLTVDYVHLQNNAASGGATFTALNSKDLGNNSGWTINQVTSKSFYWVNGTGKWSNPYHWSYTSGGPGGACIPTPIDDVYFDNNSFITVQDTVFVNINASCRNKTWTVTTSQPVFYTDFFRLNIYGSLTFCTSMINKFAENIYFEAKSTGNTITSAGQSFLGNIVFNGQGGEWTLIDNLTVLNGFIELNNGSLNTNGKKIKCKRFYSNTVNSRTLSLGASDIKIHDGGYSFVINTTNLTLNEGSSVIHLPASNVFVYLTGSTSGLKLHNIFFENQTGTSNIYNTNKDFSFNHVYFTNNGKIIGKNIFDSLSFSANMLYELDKDNTQTIIKHLKILGNNCFPITLQSTQMGYQATMIKSSGSVSGDFVHIRDIKATGGAIFYAGANSADVSNNTGWIFANSPGYVFGLGNDTLVCSNDPFILTTVNFNGGTSYLWNTGSTNPSISITQTGVYTVTVTYDNNCQIVDDIYVEYHNLPDINLGNDTLICEGILFSLNPGAGFTTYLWSDGSTGNQINVTAAGIYGVSVMDNNGCWGSDSIDVKIFPLPHINLGKNTYLCLDDSITLIAQSGYDSYQWQDGSTKEYYIVSEPGTYYLVATNRCGPGSDTISFNSIDCEFFAPNVFTPNGDGYNDKFIVIAKNITDFHLQIFNRWGNLIYRSDNIELGWDGKNKGNDCPSGVYYYTVDYSITKASGSKLIFSNQGTVTLMR